MLITGFISHKGLNNGERINDIKKVFQSYLPKNINVFRGKNIFLITGHLSENDLDVCLSVKDKSVVGRVFNKEKKIPLTQKDLEYLTLQNMLSNHWGKYLFFDLSSDKIRILRDPTGQLPFFYHKLLDGSFIFSSDIEPLLNILSDKKRYNWQYLASYIIYSDNSVSNLTAFENIKELPPGCLLNCENGDIKSLWDPFQNKNFPCDNSSIPEILKNTLSAWGKEYNNLFINLSGGLDSTALTYCLQDSLKPHQTLKAINFFHPDLRSTDETWHAKKLCEALNLELIKIDMSYHLPFSPPKNVFPMKLGRPSSLLTHSSLMEKLHSLVTESPSSLLMSGQGGDHLFLCPPTESIVIDHYVDKGFPGLSESVQNLSHYYRTTFYQILKRVLCTFVKQHFFKKRQTYKPYTEKWMTSDFKRLGNCHFVHPRYEESFREKHIGKFLQLESIDHGICSISSEIWEHNPIFSPLLYQPLLEIALSIPVYEMLKEGYDRYPFRKSISDYFQTDLVWRRSKGETTGLTQLGLQKNFDYVRSLCLEGVFAQKGLIKKDILEHYLKTFSQGENIYFWSLINLISVEMFFEVWQS